MTMSIRTFVVDDEPIARERLSSLLAGDPDLEVVGAESDGSKALARLREDAPDLLILDVPLPGWDDFAFLEAIGANERPATILLADSERYALRAFDYHAVDYLIKPFGEERLRDALQLAKERISHPEDPEIQEWPPVRLYGALDGERPTPTSHRRDLILVKSEGRLLLVRKEEIDWVEAAGNYLRLHVGKDIHLLRESMRRMESRLGEPFMRIHRSAIVKIDQIREMQPWFHGDYHVILRDGTRLTLSRNYRQKLETRFAGLTTTPSA
jgi:two-component system LytT family response regulator